jgi:hypothetical protein
MNYESRQESWIKENNISIGDKVKVVRNGADREDGWLESWATDMSGMVGKEFPVCHIHVASGIQLKEEGNAYNFYFPFFCLEKVEEDLRMIHEGIYHLTCKPRFDGIITEWIYRFDSESDKEIQTSCDGSLALEDRDFWEDKGVVASEGEIESIRWATEEEKDLFYEAEVNFQVEEVVGDDPSSKKELVVQPNHYMKFGVEVDVICQWVLNHPSNDHLDAWELAKMCDELEYRLRAGFKTGCFKEDMDKAMNIHKNRIEYGEKK